MKRTAILASLVAPLIFCLPVPAQVRTDQPPPPAGNTAAPPPTGQIPVDQANAAKAKAILDKAIQAMGGQAYLTYTDKLEQGRTYTFYHGEPNSRGTLYWRTWKWPDKERVDLTKQRDVSEIFSGDQGYEVTYKGTSAQDEKTLTEYLRRRHYSLEQVFRVWLKEPGIALFYDGPTLADRRPAEKVTIMNAKNEAVTLFINSLDFLPIKRSFSWRDPETRERNDEEEVYDSYKVFQGILTPTSVTRFLNGETTMQRMITTVTYNQNPADSLFAATVNYDPYKNPPAKYKK